MKCKIFTIIILLSFFVASTKAQSNLFQFSHLDINNGLSHNDVTSIFKDSKGFMWFGTLSGLNRYDGYDFKIFKHSASDTTSLDDDYIVSISEGPDNKLWIETRNGFNIYDPATEKFAHNIAAYLRQIGIPDPFIAAVKKDQAGNFWFLHRRLGVYRYDGRTHQTVHGWIRKRCVLIIVLRLLILYRRNSTHHTKYLSISRMLSGVMYPPIRQGYIMWICGIKYLNILIKATTTTI
jgi:ligand-binding sensor domain-containing protein